MAELTVEQVPASVKSMFNKGFAAMERGNLDYAIDLLSACVAAEPRLLQARKFLRAAEFRRAKSRRSSVIGFGLTKLTNLPAYLLALLSLRSRKREQAVARAERLLRHAPLDLQYLELFVRAAAGADLPEAAIQTLEIARDHYPDEIRLLTLLGVLYLKVGRNRDARKLFEHVCALRPNDPAAVKSLKDAMAMDSMVSDGWAGAAERGGSYREMLRDEEEATILEKQSKAVQSESDAEALIVEAKANIEEQPENVNYYRALARLYAHNGRFEEARDTLRRALEISPGDPELDRSLTVVRVQEFDAGIKALEAAGNAEDAAARKHERDEFVFGNLQERVQRYPNDLQLRHELGLEFFERGDLNQAIQQFQLARRSPRTRTRTLYYLARCFKQKQQFDMALEQLKTAAEEIPGIDDVKKDILYEAGQILELTGKPEEAGEYYKQIYQVDIGYKDIAEKIEQLYSSGNRDAG